jgi:hypothetical protein
MNVDQRRVATYRRLMDAEMRVAELRERYGATPEELTRALELSGREADGDDDIYLAELARFVAALGGHIEVRAVFPEEVMTVLRQPGPANAPGPGETP